MVFPFVFLFTTIVTLCYLFNTLNHQIMSSKVMKTTMRLFRCHQIHRLRHRNRGSSYAMMEIKPFSFVAFVCKSIHKCHRRIIKFLSELASPKRHQSFVLHKAEEESDIAPKIKLKLKLDTSFSVPRVSVLHKQQQQHQHQHQHQQYLLPPLVSTKKRTIILDLDETLVHSTTDPPPLNYDFMIKPVFNGVAMNFYVLKRPGVDEFLDAMSKKYEIVVFTAGLEPYASMLLDVLDPKGLISHRLYRDSCKQLTKTRFVKDLSMLGRDLGNVVIVDDNPRSYIWQPENGIPIKRFVNDVEDRELGKLLGFFERDCDGFEDMRDAVKQYICNATTTSCKINHHPHNTRDFDHL